MKLDFELKSDVQKAIHAARKAEPNGTWRRSSSRSPSSLICLTSTTAFRFPTRALYDLDNDDQTAIKARSGHEDIEVLHRRLPPRPSPRQGAGRVSTSMRHPADRATLTAKIEGDHHLMENILELVTMTVDLDSSALESLGYTEREAAFLYLVAAHSGYFLRRQFDYFIDRQQRFHRRRAFLKRRVPPGMSKFSTTGRVRHVYHLFSKPIYRLLGNAGLAESAAGRATARFVRG